MSMEECSRRTSIDLDQRGYFVVEEISEDDDVTDGARVSSTASASASCPPGSPAVVVEGPPLMSTASKPQFNPMRREFGNISPISEDFSESDKETDENGRVCVINGGAGASEDDLDDTRTSTTAVAGDTSLLLNRLSCSSPILAQSPSLRKTPIVVAVAAMEEAESSPVNSAKGKKLRNFARALDDISDREEDDDEVVLMGSKDSDDDDMMDEGCSFEVPEEGGVVSEDEEKTESFEIDLNNSAEGQNEDGCSPFSMKTSDSYVEFGAAVANLEKLKLSQDQERQEVIKEQQERQRTVWETLFDNIETHISGGNTAGFVSGPIDHPIHVSRSPEPTEPHVLSLEELELIDGVKDDRKEASS